MSDVPTVQQLLLELKEVDDWYPFGVALGVPVCTLNEFKQSNGGVGQWKIEVYQYWLNTADAPSWRIIVDVLNQLSYYNLAKRISRTYLQKPSSPFVETEEGSTPQIPADTEVIQQLQALQLSFSHMLTDIRNLLANSDPADARFFLSDHLDTDEFRSCGSIEDLLYQLRQGHVDTFNTHCLEQVLIRFEREDAISRVKAYKEKMDQFLTSTTVLSFQQAVLCTAKPAVPEGKEVITITVSKKWANRKTLKDVMTLAEKSFEENHATFISFNVVPKSILITWFFPKKLEATLRQLAVKNSALFQEQDVDEVTVAGRTFYTRTGMLNTGASSEKPRLKTPPQDTSSAGALHHLESLFDALSAHRNVLETEISGIQDQLSYYKELSESLSKEKEVLEIRVNVLDKQLEEAKGINDELKLQKVKLQEQLEALLHGIQEEDVEEEKEECSDGVYQVCQDLLAQAFSNRSIYNSAVHLLQSKSLLPMEEKLVSKLRQELPSVERASSLLKALSIKNLQGLMYLIDLMKLDEDLLPIAEEMLVEIDKREQDPSLKRVDQIRKILTAQIDENTELKEQRAELFHQITQLEKEGKIKEDKLREVQETMQKVAIASNTAKESVPSQSEFTTTVIEALPDKWYNFGEALRIDTSELESIKRQHKEPDFCFLEVFYIWQSNAFTWKCAREILESMGERQVVEVISERYDVET